MRILKGGHAASDDHTIPCPESKRRVLDLRTNLLPLRRLGAVAEGWLSLCGPLGFPELALAYRTEGAGER